MQFIDPKHFEIIEPQVLPCETVLGQPLVSASANDTAQALLSEGRKTVFFFNAHCANLRAQDTRYKVALDRAQYVLPDGIGVELAAKMEAKTLCANLNGTDFVPQLLAEGAALGKSVYLLGGTPGTAIAAAKALRANIPGLQIAGTRDGYDGMVNTANVIADINASGAEIVVAALGVPMQEIWVTKHRAALNADVVLGVGALLDFLAGNVRRAPKLVRKTRMEWV